MNNREHAAALDGIRVVDLGGSIACLVTTMVLAEIGRAHV